MKPDVSVPATYEWISKSCGALAVVISGAALVGWLVGSVTLKGIGTGYIPMAPNTALIFVFLGAILATFTTRSTRFLYLVRSVLALVGTVVAIRFGEYLTGIDLRVDHWFFSFPAEHLGLAPVGKMAFFTALTFLLLGVAFVLLTLPKQRWANDASRVLSVVVGFIGLAFILGYMYGAPLLYGGRSIPMAMNTAICFLISGAGLFLKAYGRDVAERQAAKEALQKAHDELEDRVAERTVELTKAVAALKAEITERELAQQALREAEEQLRQAQKLEAVGQLAGGIAHDFNNLLTVIGGYTDLLLMGDKLEQPVREKMAEVKKASERASSLTRQLLAFSRKQLLKPEVLDLNLLIEGTGKILRRLIGEDIEVLTNLRTDVGKIKADPGQIEQVVINLALNARDAMPNGGKIMLETANVELDREYADMRIAVKPGRYVMLAVSDTGTGMPADVQKHIFEPFFTTKEVGKGTGLGLSMIYGIVKQSGGNIWVYSELGQGTTFKVYLPLAVGGVETNLIDETPQVVTPKASETVLLVEDEAMVRNLAADILRAKGYQVLIAKSGEEATEICKTHRQPIHLLLADVIMPRMNGKEVAEMVKSFQPGVEVLYMSGYTDDIIVHHGVLEAGTNFIEKPFTAEVLTRRVHEVLRHEAPTKFVPFNAEPVRPEAV